MSHYFLTGATGFVGGRLARLLRAAAHDVTTVVRDPAKAADLVALGVRVHAGDITRRDTLDRPMAGADGVFHVAGWYKVGVRDVSEGEAINVRGTRNVLEAMRDLGTPRGVYTSTLAVFGDTRGKLVDESYRAGGPWLTEYDRTKWAAHVQVAEPMMRDGLPLVIVQPGLIYGPGDASATGRTLRNYLRGRLAATPRGAEYCWSHVDDIANAHVLAMERGRPGEEYIIAGPRHSLVEAFEIAERVTGLRAPPLHPAPGMMRAMAAMMGVVERFVTVPETFTREGLRVVAGVTYLGDNARARRELGYAPRPLEQGLRETLLPEMERLGLTPHPRA